MRHQRRFLKTLLSAWVLGFSSFLFATNGFATLEAAKVYKAAFPDEEKPKCTACHVDKTPKKGDGKHDLNDYGKAVLAAKDELKKEKVDEEVLKKAGPCKNG